MSLPGAIGSLNEDVSTLDDLIAGIFVVAWIVSDLVDRIKFCDEIGVEAM